MAKLQWNGSISTNTNTDITGLTVGLHYGVRISYPSGATGTITPQELADDDTTYDGLTKDASEVTVTATGKDRGFIFQASSSTLRLVSASVAGGSIYYKVYEIPHGH